MMTGTMEITTKIGCSVQCEYCLQALLMHRYTSDKDRPTMMSMETYTRCIDKLPPSVKIDFAGMCEPWIPPRCTDMVEYAYHKGHPIGIFTTMVGITQDDVPRLAQVQIDQLVVHLPDQGNHTTIQADDFYLSLLTQVLHYINVKNWGISCHGALPDAMREIVTMDWDIGNTLISR